MTFKQILERERGTAFPTKVSNRKMFVGIFGVGLLILLIGVAIWWAIRSMVGDPPTLKGLKK